MTGLFPFRYSFLYLLLNLFLLSSCNKKQQIYADTVVVNATFWTPDVAMDTIEAMAIKGDTILAIGKRKTLNEHINATTTVIDAKGKMVVPGFIDAHVHLLMGGNSLLNVALRDVDNKQEFITKIEDFAKTLNSDEWIVEGNWDHTLWGGELPNKSWIDSVTPNTPVAIYRMDGHMILANSAAIKIAGIDTSTLNPAKGEIVKDAEGEPTGILKSEAMYLVLDKIPPLSPEKKIDAILKAQNYFLSQGVTSVHDVDSLGGFSVLQKMYASNQLKVRVYSADPLPQYRTIDPNTLVANKWIKNGLLKGFMDGSLGSHTAAFNNPYSDSPKDKGILMLNNDTIFKWIEEADMAGFKITVHAIGDKANTTLLNAYEAVLRKNPEKEPRFRIEHAQHLDPKDIPRFSSLKVIASMQPYHAIDDGRWAEELIGKERAKTTYAFNSLLQANALLAFGSDWPVAPASPLYGIYAATTRRTLDDNNPEGWYPAEKMSVTDALKAYTINAAYSEFSENIKGSLAVGKLADFVILSEDLTKIKPEQIKDVNVMATYVGGKLEYSKD
ncbi:amidohydrolase [Croceivirga sp. JEA036]|uniref:amidohydrolase n=1 Tax=Croceivirga sp. JEA036 TaxID=2721162 RepID=UPI00143A0F1D|nr:amidohydrolase [Croceivirga sp. JEA036]NJB36457.1 amidohydrolase [Croceivirga sp. JEA036]